MITYNYWVTRSGLIEAERISAKPGHSEHQLGTTIDITTSDVAEGIDFGDTDVSLWLADNSYKYGFVLSYAPGTENITENIITVATIAMSVSSNTTILAAETTDCLAPRYEP